MGSLIINNSYVELLKGDFLAAACLTRIEFSAGTSGGFARTKKQWADTFFTTEGKVDKALHKLDKLKYIRIGWTKPPGGYRISVYFFQEKVVEQAVRDMYENYDLKP
jgi:hypothetical protein